VEPAYSIQRLYGNGIRDVVIKRRLDVSLKCVLPRFAPRTAAVLLRGGGGGGQGAAGQQRSTAPRPENDKQQLSCSEPKLKAVVQILPNSDVWRWIHERGADGH
jgi:hypothetical protein